MSTLIANDSSYEIKKKDMPQLLVESMTHLIRYNNNIQCINLDNTGLNEKVLVGLVPGVRHAKSLLCLHLG